MAALFYKPRGILNRAFIPTSYSRRRTIRVVRWVGRWKRGGAGCWLRDANTPSLWEGIDCWQGESPRTRSYLLHRVSCVLIEIFPWEGGGGVLPFARWIKGRRYRRGAAVHVIRSYQGRSAPRRKALIVFVVIESAWRWRGFILQINKFVVSGRVWRHVSLRLQTSVSSLGFESSIRETPTWDNHLPLSGSHRIACTLTNRLLSLLQSLQVQGRGLWGRGRWPPRDLSSKGSTVREISNA